MISLHSEDLIREALNQLDPRLHRLLAKWICHTISAGLADMTHIIVLSSGDSEADLIAEIGMSPLVNPADNIRFGSPGYVPWWDGLTYVDGWWEMVIVVGSSGFSYILLISDADGKTRELLTLCRAYQEPCDGLDCRLSESMRRP